MSAHDWSKVTEEHVFRAIRRYEEAPGEYPWARNTFLIINGKRYPAKAIRGIAYEICYGRPISRDDYTGGLETQRFLEGLGFAVEHRGAATVPEEREVPQERIPAADHRAPNSQLPAQTDPARPVTLARVVANLGVTPRGLRDLGNSGSDVDLWLGHRRHLCQVYRQDPHGYRERLQALLTACVRQGADIVLLPACTMLYEADATFDGAFQPYREMSRALPWIVSGALEVTDDACGEETVVILHEGNVVERFRSGKVVGMQMAGVTAYSASSSSICELRGGNVVVSPAGSLLSGSPILGLDSGHHQYSGRYTLSLGSVSRALAARHGVPNLVALAYWKYRDGQSYCPWLFGESRHTRKTLHTASIVGGAGQIDVVTLISLGSA